MESHVASFCIIGCNWGCLLEKEGLTQKEQIHAEIVVQIWELMKNLGWCGAIALNDTLLSEQLFFADDMIRMDC